MTTLSELTAYQPTEVVDGTESHTDLVALLQKQEQQIQTLTAALIESRDSLSLAHLSEARIDNWSGDSVTLLFVKENGETLGLGITPHTINYGKWSLNGQLSSYWEK